MGTTSAALSCMAYGYEVKVRINGTDLGMRGGKSESRRLFSPADPMVAEIPPEMRAPMVVLKDGANRVEIEFRKTGGADDNMEVMVYEDPEAPAFVFRSRAKTSGRIDGTFHFGAPVALSDADVR
jgi:hypothetical protein